MCTGGVRKRRILTQRLLHLLDIFVSGRRGHLACFPFAISLTPRRHLSAVLPMSARSPQHLGAADQVLRAPALQSSRCRALAASVSALHGRGSAPHGWKGGLPKVMASAERHLAPLGLCGFAVQPRVVTRGSAVIFGCHPSPSLLFRNEDLVPSPPWMCWD